MFSVPLYQQYSVLWNFAPATLFYLIYSYVDTFNSIQFRPMYRTARKMCLPFRKNVLTIYEQCAICAEKCECRLGKMLLPSTKICYTAQDKCPGKFYCHPGKICFSHKKCVLTLKKKCARKDVLSIHDKFSNRPGKMCLLSWNNVLTVQEKCALQCW